MCRAIHLNKKTKLLSLNLIKKTICEFATMGILAVSFTGGEVFLYKNLLNILKLLRKYRIMVNINTNGLLLPIYWNEYRRHVYSYSIGINALDKTELQKLCVFLQKIKRQKNRPKIIIRIVINNKNIFQLFNLQKTLKPYCDWILYQPIHKKITANDYIGNGQKDDLLSFENIKTLSALKNNTKDKTLAAYISYMKYKKKYSCNAGVFTLFIDPFGNIYNCCHMLAKTGKINFSCSVRDSYKKSLLNRKHTILRSNNCKKFCFTNDRRLDFYLPFRR